ncbi:hypothetical protein JTB14_038409 [Gonioctena quinquepunctata]|nr:hypothetical protein JTB14_038409 [Gonioctena quinquepunctata]
MENLHVCLQRSIYYRTLLWWTHKLLVDGLTRHLSENGIGYSLITLPQRNDIGGSDVLQIYNRIPKLTRKKSFGVAQYSIGRVTWS